MVGPSPRLGNPRIELAKSMSWATPQLRIRINFHPARCPQRPHGLISSDQADKNLERLHLRIVFLIQSLLGCSSSYSVVIDS